MFGSALQGTMAQLVEEAPITAEDIEDAVAATNVEFAGGITPSGGITGTGTNDSAAAGVIGEYITVEAANDSVDTWSTDVAKNITSQLLTAGDWDVDGCIVWHDIHAGSGTYVNAVLSLSSASVGGSLTAEGFAAAPGIDTLDAYWTMHTGTRRISLAAPATVYLVGRLGFSTGTPTAGGRLRCRRVR